MKLNPGFAPRRPPRVPTILVEELHLRLQGRQQSLLLDVREPWEYAQGHVPGAQLVPLNELEERVCELPRDRPVYSICHSGQRSLAAAAFLLSEGFSEVSNVEGGTSAWIHRGFPIDR
ncbi:MAG TPA: rhodanese-like domain-containing protein [Candidatus Dormibacteraeota bacterium]|nr:rhodanese-like domain-containing protein [Candidatus Dormibacteraeota bacterium]